MLFKINHLFCFVSIGQCKKAYLNNEKTFLSFLVVAFLCVSCKKTVEIDQPVNSITTEGAFSTDATANAAVAGIYSNLINTGSNPKFASGGITLYCGLSSDELARLSITGTSFGELQQNALLPNNGVISAQFWTPAYFAIYQTNVCLEGLAQSETITPALKSRLIGECKFLRAFSYFYLTNLWGDIPLSLTSDWRKTYLMPRTNRSEVYMQIISDLQQAQSSLPEDYSFTTDERIRATKYAATAMLARVYLFQQKWAEAETAASLVINNTTLYNLVSDLNSVYLRNSQEAILQFQPTNKVLPWAVVEQYVITRPLIWYLTNDLLSAFEANDQRKLNWTKTKLVSGTTYYYPYKYKISQGTANATPAEYYMVLRLAEQYLIRAEARAHLNKFAESQSDLNAIRSRAGLPNTTATDQASLLAAVEHERQVELFAEWGHRWFDLIRTNRATAVLAPIKGSSWQATDVLYPVPFSEMQRDPSLTQNPGY
jgi:starch-binding outer membrane protein, SusD/RagB family